MKKFSILLTIIWVLMFPTSIYAADENTSLVEKNTIQYTDVSLADENTSLTEKVTATQTDVTADNLNQQLYTTGDIIIFCAICLLCGLIAALIFWNQIKFR